AAAEARRIDGRYNVLSRAVFSPCLVCPEDPTPLWRIRADRIVHDERTRTVHYENATFDVLGVPLAWTPYFRHPDPTLKRASGVLPPVYRQNSNFGQGLKLPYYFVLSDQADLTLTPYITTDDGLIMEGEYRAEFERASLSLAGSITQQDYDGDDELRGHVFGAGLYRFGDGVEAGFTLEQASDDGYLRRYEFSEDDRLESEVFLRASDQDGWGEVSLVRFQSLRDNEPFGQIPQAIPTVEGRRVWDAPLGGRFGLDMGGYYLKRTEGQDTLHGFLGVDYEKSWITRPGIQFTAYGDLRGDSWRIDDVPGITPGSSSDERSRFGPTLALEARYPLLRRDADGDWLSWAFGAGPVTHLVEPIAQAVFSTYTDDSPALPNEDSQLVEF
ncbi:MAG: LPS assembly protein LptD, partial [Pseudomonadota bacterium]|nr:LPS assembly protein LptD [Pseudomonadota bacterium]